MGTVFRIIEHTADTGIVFRGNSFSDMLENAAKGMFSLIVDRRTVRPAVDKQIKISGIDYEEVTINWLRELHYVHQSSFFLFREFICEKIDESDRLLTVVFKVRGEPVDNKRHSIFLDIKLVTYHMFYVQKKKNVWEGRVIFDI